MTSREPATATPEPAASLPLDQLAGARIVAGFNGAAAPPALRRAIREGQVAGVDIAPVLDVPRPGSPIADTYRGYGTTPAAVSAIGNAFPEGLQQGGVAATAKHFPGLGAAQDDTDVDVSRIGLSKARLRAVDEAPYRRYATIGGDLVMVGAAIYPAFSPRPAAFSRPLVTGELRHRLAYRGIVMTDALDTVSVTAFGTPSQTALAAVRVLDLRRNLAP